MSDLSVFSISYPSMSDSYTPPWKFGLPIQLFAPTYLGSKCRQHMDHHDRHQTTGMVFGNDLAIHFLTMPCAAESCKVASILQHPLVFIASLVFMNKTMGRISWHNIPYIHCCKALFKDIKLSFCSIYLWLQTICFRTVFRPTNRRIYPKKFSETRRYITMSHSLTNPLDTVHSVSSCSLWQWIFLKIWEYKDESHDSCDNTWHSSSTDLLQLTYLSRAWLITYIGNTTWQHRLTEKSEDKDVLSLDILQILSDLVYLKQILSKQFF